jgi:hypothetical protein
VGGQRNLARNRLQGRDSTTGKDRRQVAPRGPALDNAQITVGAVTECAQRLLVLGTVRRGDGLRGAVEFKEDDALGKPTLVNARAQPACQEAAARGFRGGTGQPGGSRTSATIVRWQVAV